MKPKLLLLLPVLVFLFLSRLIFLSSNPPSLFSDEADISYQAFTFNRCATDYFGNRYPFHFHSYADWQPPLYIYSVSVAQKFFGPSSFSTRLPAALYGITAVIIFIFMVRFIFGTWKSAVFSAIAVSFSPWLMHFSRAGFGVTGMLFSLLAAFLFWFHYLKSKKTIKLLLSSFFLILSVYFYSTATLFVLLVFFTVLAIWFRDIMSIPLRIKTLVLLSLVIFSLPMAIDVFKGTAGYRFSYINIFSDPTVPTQVNYSRFQDIVLNHPGEIGVSPSLISKIFHNRATVILETFYKNYISAVSADFLFLKSDSNLRQGFGSHGYFLILDLPLLLVGLSVAVGSLLQKLKNSYRRYDLFFLILLILSPIPYALTRDSLSPNATRLILMLPSMLYFIVRGFNQLSLLITSKFLYRLFILSGFFVYLISVSAFIHFYFFHYPNLSARSWHTGMDQALSFASSVKNDLPVFLSNKFEPFQPFFLYHTRYVPADSSCSPASALVHTDTPYFSGLKSDNGYYLGQVEWSLLTLNNIPKKGAVFVVPGIEFATVKSNLNSDLHLNILKTITPRYTESEEFIIFKVTSDNL